MLRRTCGTFQGDPATVSALLGVPRILDALRAHYGGVPSSPDAGRPACGGGLQPVELRALRQGLLNVALSLLAAQSVPSHKAPRILAEDMQVRLCAVFCCELWVL